MSDEAGSAYYQDLQGAVLSTVAGSARWGADGPVGRPQLRGVLLRHQITALVMPVPLRDSQRMSVRSQLKTGIGLTSSQSRMAAARDSRAVKESAQRSYLLRVTAVDPTRVDSSTSVRAGFERSEDEQAGEHGFG